MRPRGIKNSANKVTRLLAEAMGISPDLVLNCQWSAMKLKGAQVCSLTILTILAILTIYDNNLHAPCPQSRASMAVGTGSFDGY